jgi:Plant mobile domain
VEARSLKIDTGLLSTLIKFWRPETHIFHLNFGEMTVTLGVISQIFFLILLKIINKVYSNENIFLGCAYLWGLSMINEPVTEYTNEDFSDYIRHLLGHDNILAFCKDDK